MEFIFSIRKAIRESWILVWNNIYVFLILTAVMVALSIHRQSDHILLLVGSLLALVIFFSLLKLVFGVLDGKKVPCTLETFGQALPTFRQYFSLVAIRIITGVLVLLPPLLFCILCVVVIRSYTVLIFGLLVFVIVSVYVALRLQFSAFSYVDSGHGIIASLKRSWNLTAGNCIWTLILTAIVSIAILAIGAILLGVGILVAYPLVLLVRAKLYRALSKYKTHTIG